MISYSQEVYNKDDEDQNHLKKLLESNRDKTCALNFMDFVTAATDHQILLAEKNIQKLFTLLDCDKDGKISIEDLKTAF